MLHTRLWGLRGFAVTILATYAVKCDIIEEFTYFWVEQSGISKFSHAAQQFGIYHTEWRDGTY
jgi:hypothetical protein